MSRFEVVWELVPLSRVYAVKPIGIPVKAIPTKMPK